VPSGAAIGTIVGTGRADLNRTHVFNPNPAAARPVPRCCRPGTVAGSQLLALWLIWRPAEQGVERELAVKTAAQLPVIAWTPFFSALATPGTRVEDEPGHLPRLAGVPANLVPAALVPAIAWLGHQLHRRGL
jgi:hypothetical protein